MFILRSESNLFLTLGLGTSSAQDENLRPLQQKHIPNLWDIWRQTPLLTTGKWFSHKEK